MKQILSNKKTIILAVVLLLFAGAAVFAVWSILSLVDESTISRPEPVKFEYCGAFPEGLCVLSFGRDSDGNAIINLFVPEDAYPDFYMIVTSASGQNRYECRTNEDVPTSVYCFGSGINLNAKIEADIFSVEGDLLLARGRFLVEAFLISTPPVSLEASTSEPFAAESPTLEIIETVTATESFAYPNSAYP